jgi:hypothetical protein
MLLEILIHVLCVDFTGLDNNFLEKIVVKMKLAHKLYLCVIIDYDPKSDHYHSSEEVYLAVKLDAEEAYRNQQIEK